MTPLLRNFSAAAGGFAVACLVVRLAVRPLVVNPAADYAIPAESSAVAPRALPEEGAFSSLSATSRVDMIGRFIGLTPAQRAGWLADALQRPEPERTTFIALIVHDWAQTDPAAAGDWVLAELKDDCRVECFQDIVESWAARNGAALAAWWNGVATRQPPPPGPPGIRYLTGAVQQRLRHHDTLAFARFQEMECVKNPYGDPGDKFIERKLATPNQIASMATAVAAEIAYQPGAVDWDDNYGQARHANKKNVWNVLFEDTAVAWHRSDPAACEAWLSTFPENAQTAARHFISENEKSRNPPPVSREPSKPESPPIPPQQRLTDAPPAPGPAEDAARRDWSEWWRADPAAAEAFLNSAAWPDNLKFRTRASAYSSVP